MKRLYELLVLFNTFFHSQKSKNRDMKRVFQWRRYLEWKELTLEEKLAAKRFVLVPLFAYLIIGFFNQNFLLIVFILIGYVLYKKYQKGDIVKK